MLVLVFGYRHDQQNHDMMSNVLFHLLVCGDVLCFVLVRRRQVAQATTGSTCCTRISIVPWCWLHVMGTSFMGSAVTFFTVAMDHVLALLLHP